MKKAGVSMVRSIMLSGNWFTIPKIQKLVRSKYNRHYMETTISARIRSLRVSKNGGYQIDRQYVPVSKLWRYRLVH